MQLENDKQHHTSDPLQDSDELLRAMIENLPGGAAFVVDLDLRYRLAEGEALSVAGFKPKDLVGRTIFEILPPDLATSYEVLYRKALEGEVFELEHEAHDRFYISRGTPLRSVSGEVYAVLAVSYDITERKLAEASVAADLEDTQRLRDLSVRLVTDDDIQTLYQEIVATAIALTRADAGALQILDEATQDLVLLATQGSTPEMIEHFHRVNASSNTSCGMALATGDRTFVDFDVPESEDPYGSMRMHLEAGLLSAQSTPLITRSGKAIGMFSTHWRKHHRPSDRELRFLDLLARQAADVIEQWQAEATVRQSEAKYRSLFESIDKGFSIIEILFNEEGQAIDYLHLEGNSAQEKLMGQAVVGKRAREIAPNLEQHWIEDFATVALTGVPIRVEKRVGLNDRWFNVHASRLGDENSRQVAIVFDDITDRKRREANLAFLAQIAEDSSRLASEEAIMQRTGERLATHLGLDGFIFSYVDEERESVTIKHGWSAADVPQLLGTFRFAEYMTEDFIRSMRAGETWVVCDTQHDARTNAQANAAIGVGSLFIVPYHRRGEWQGALSVNCRTMREWRMDEIALIEEVSNRTFPRLERARAEESLRESEIGRVREQSAREQERQRAEALAELDRAKTLFFSNVSHEFRTPLTLSLAPLQDALSDRTHPLDPVHRGRLEFVHRNSLRLLKLVNTLLDFSRIEAGRMEAVYEPTDLAMFTTELTSVFRSASERAGLQLIVNCPPLSEPVFVDRQMWEKIVLNLLSNAFKFTFEGEIRVSLRSTNCNQAILQIQDTGSGISSEHLPHLFERFYQVRGTKGRSHEGSGIGLALVHELVQLQGGTIEVTSTVGEGTCFTISLPFGTDHLPSDRLQDEGDRQPSRILASTAMSATTYVEEAERWLPTGDNREGTIENAEAQIAQIDDSSFSTVASQFPEGGITSARVLLVDDNADMREYLTRILNKHVQVEAVADGTIALAVAQARVPDLILSDVMMPGLDGFGLLAALRSDPRTREVPIVLLSARAGEEAIVEGLNAGADDYLIKPFSAQELISRVTAHLQMAQLRSQALQEARSTIRSRDEFISVVSHELNTPLVSILGWTRLLRTSPLSPSMLTKALDTIERNATLQARLVQDLLDVSRITAGKLRLNPQTIGLESVIETAIATVTQTAMEKGVNLTWQKNATDSIVVMGDSDRLQQVICNLLTNAIKFTPASGSVTVELSVVNDHSPNTAHAVIRVTDTGIGIAADFLPHVFDSFRQAKDSGKGLGLGLVIAHHLVELHHGAIHAESAGEGQGATFIVKLALHPSGMI